MVSTVPEQNAVPPAVPAGPRPGPQTNETLVKAQRMLTEFGQHAGESLKKANWKKIFAWVLAIGYDLVAGLILLLFYIFVSADGLRSLNWGFAKKLHKFPGLNDLRDLEG